MVTGVAGGVAAEGARQLLRGERPALRDLLLTPANAHRVATDLARMRGAAMKLGQLLSLDDGAMLPPELAAILARLRDSAVPMTPKQLKSVLVAEWGPDFTRRFKRFDPHPIAAASIGQVHRAQTRDGRDLAIKIQYPGVRDSIDSDIKSLGGLLKIPGLVPKEADLSELLEAARQQLHAETDYLLEADHLATFGRHLANNDTFILPAVHSDLTSSRVLAMTYIEAEPIETLSQASQDMRDRVISSLITLTLRELYQFGLMQTDPNFANYRYQPETGRIVLLDFGATVAFGPERVAECRALLDAGLSGELKSVGACLANLGFVDPREDPEHYGLTMELVALAMAPLRDETPFDIANSDLTTRLMEAGLAIPPAQALRHVPPHDLMFLQRKVAGLYLLASRLGARIPIRGLLTSFRDQQTKRT